MSIATTIAGLERANAVYKAAQPTARRGMLAVIERRHWSTYMHGKTVISLSYTPAIVSSVSRDGTAQEVRVAAPAAYGPYRVNRRDWESILVDTRGQCGNPDAVCAALVDDRGFAIEYETRDRAIEAIRAAIKASPAATASPAQVPLHDRLTRAALVYDERCAKRERVPNPYRIGHILGGIERAEQRIAAGATVRAALCASFNDRLLDAMLKAAGEPKATLAEVRGHA
jgi:hypothetical protein